jgi:hypothetical protein
VSCAGVAAAAAAGRPAARLRQVQQHSCCWQLLPLLGGLHELLDHAARGRWGLLKLLVQWLHQGALSCPVTSTGLRLHGSTACARPVSCCQQLLPRLVLGTAGGVQQQRCQLSCKSTWATLAAVQAVTLQQLLPADLVAGEFGSRTPWRSGGGAAGAGSLCYRRSCISSGGAAGRCRQQP